MSKTFNSIVKSVIISPKCREYFLPLDRSFTRALQHCGVSCAGASELVAPYEMGRPDVPWHVLMYTRGGHGRFQTSTEEGELLPGSLSVFPAHQPYRYWADGQWSCVWFHIDDTDCWKGVGDHSARCGKTPFGERIMAAVDGLLAEINVLEADDHAFAAAQAYSEILATLLRRELARFVGNTATEQPQLIQHLRQLVQGQPGNTWGVEELAEQLGVSPVTVHRLTNKYLGISPKTLVTSVRMQCAQELLRSTDYLLAHIATLVGYASPFAFSRAFSQHVGVSPKEFRLRFHGNRP